MFGVVFTLACGLPAAAAGESAVSPVWPSEYGGESVSMTAAVERYAMEPDPVAPDETPAKPGGERSGNDPSGADLVVPDEAPKRSGERFGNDPSRADPVVPEAPTKASAYHRPGPTAGAPDWQGAARDAAYFVGYQVVGFAVLATLPESITGWSHDDKRNGFKEWREHVTNPVWDDDNWWLNYVTHPYWGGAYYIRGRERGLDRWQSFWYSALLSTLWEFGVEAVAEPVSIQDMIVTPVLGSLVGEYLFSPWRAHIRAKGGPLSWSDKAVMVLTDPLGTINDQLDRWLGVKTSLQLQPIGARSPGRHPVLGPPLGAAQKSGITGWRLQLHMAW